MSFVEKLHAIVGDKGLVLDTQGCCGWHDGDGVVR